MNKRICNPSSINGWGGLSFEPSGVAGCLLALFFYCFLLRHLCKNVYTLALPQLVHLSFDLPEPPGYGVWPKSWRWNSVDSCCVALPLLPRRRVPWGTRPDRTGSESEKGNQQMAIFRISYSWSSASKAGTWGPFPFRCWDIWKLLVATDCVWVCVLFFLRFRTGNIGFEPKRPFGGKYWTLKRDFGTGEILMEFNHQLHDWESMEIADSAQHF